MAKATLTDEKKELIRKMSATLTTQEIAGQLFGIGEKIVQKYLDTLVIDTANTSTPISSATECVTEIAAAPILGAKPGGGAVVMTEGASLIVDQTVGGPKDLRGRATSINPNRPTPPGLLLDEK